MRDIIQTHPERIILLKYLTLCLSILLVNSFITPIWGQQPTFKEKSMVQNFYVINHQQYYWFSSHKKIKKATEWLAFIKSSEDQQFSSEKLQNTEIQAALNSKSPIDSTYKKKIDWQITDIVLNFIKTLQQGNIYFNYDEVSTQRDSIYINQLLHLKSWERVSKTVKELDCKDPDYMVLKKYVHNSISSKDTIKYKKALLAMNYRRYFSINHPSEYIIVNIPAAQADYYKNNSLLINMRIVAGKEKRQTPTIASYITDITTFPYWNVPHSIGVKEILPKVQKDDNYLEQENFDVVDAKGNIIEESELNWKDYNENNFPYFFRQSTGADNALGVLKFNFKNPYSIFLHATSWQGVFKKDDRFLSHGCVRLEKPFELAKALLKNKINIKELKNSKADTPSNTITLSHKIPVFIIYMPVAIAGQNVYFLKDVYGLIQ